MKKTFFAAMTVVAISASITVGAFNSSGTESELFLAGAEALAQQVENGTSSEEWGEMLNVNQCTAYLNGKAVDGIELICQEVNFDAGSCTGSPCNPLD